MITVNAFTAADSVIIPVQAHYLPLKGMTQLTKTISKVQKQINPKLRIDGIVLTLVAENTNLAKTTEQTIRDYYGSRIKVFDTHIPMAIKCKVFGKLSKEVEQDVVQVNAMQSELNGAKGHLKNIGRLLIGREAKETEQAKSDKGVLSRFGKLLEKIGKGFGTLSQKAMDKADQIRVSHVKESVKNELDTLKGIKQGRTIPDPFRER